MMAVAYGGILRKSLRYDRNGIIVVTNIQPDHLELRMSSPWELLADYESRCGRIPSAMRLRYV